MTEQTPRWTRQPPDVRRRQLLDAAATVLKEKGYESMTVAEVATVAGVGKGTVYLYFDSKQSILVGLQDRYWEQMLGIVGEILDGEIDSWAGALDDLIDRLVAFGAEEVDLYHALFDETPTTGGEPVDEFIKLIADLLQRGRAAAEFDIVDPEITSQFLVSAFHGLAPKLAHAGTGTRRRMVPQLKALFRRTVGIT